MSPSCAPPSVGRARGGSWTTTWTMVPPKPNELTPARQRHARAPLQGAAVRRNRKRAISPNAGSTR
jgi:hypothetical protein